MLSCLRLWLLWLTTMLFAAVVSELRHSGRLLHANGKPSHIRAWVLLLTLAFGLLQIVLCLLPVGGLALCLFVVLVFVRCSNTRDMSDSK